MNSGLDSLEVLITAWTIVLSAWVLSLPFYSIAKAIKGEKNVKVHWDPTVKLKTHDDPEVNDSV